MTTNMNYNDDRYRLIGIYIITAAALILWLLTGCTTTQYVPIETVKTEYVSRTDTVSSIDTVFSEKETIIREADSALVARLGLQLAKNQKAILILQRELERQVSQREERLTDTVYRDKEIQVPVPVERKLNAWERVCLEYGKLMMGGSVVAVILILLTILRWIRRKRK